MIWLVEHAGALAIVVTLLGLAGRVVGAPFDRDGEGLGALRWPVRFGLGAVAWIVALFGLASIGWLGAPGIAAVTLALGAGAAALGTREPGSAAEAAGDRAVLERIVLGGVIGGIVVAVFVLAARPGVFGDSATYHLTLPKHYLAAGGFVPIPLSFYQHLPLGTEMLFALALLVDDAATAKLLHAAFGVATVGAIVTGARRLGLERAGWLGAALLLANGIVLFELQVAYVDLATAFFTATSFLAIDRAARSIDPRRALVLAGVLAGGLASVKISGLATAATLGVVWLAAGPRPERFGERLRLGLLWFGLPAFALALPWLARTTWATGNPFFPLLWGWFGGVDWSAEIDRQFTTWQRSMGMGRELLDYLALPLRVVTDGGPGYDRFQGSLGLHWLGVVPITVAWALTLGGRSEGPGGGLARRALGAAGLGFVLWAATSQQMRFLLPTLALLAIAGGVALDALSARRPWVRAVATLGVAATLGWVAGPTVGDALAVAPGFARSREAIVRSGVPPIFALVNATLPADAKLLFLDHNQGFFCDRAFVADSAFEASQLAELLRPARDAEAVHAWITGAGFTHLLVATDRGARTFHEPVYDMVARNVGLEPLHRSPDGRFLLYRVRATPSATSSSISAAP